MGQTLGGCQNSNHRIQALQNPRLTAPQRGQPRSRQLQLQAAQILLAQRQVARQVVDGRRRARKAAPSGQVFLGSLYNLLPQLQEPLQQTPKIAGGGRGGNHVESLPKTNPAQFYA
ncbi:hypothetical protein ACVWVQ_002667 [Thermostichus sp. MS-CIW-36]|jgi:hypothetical protein